MSLMTAEDIRRENFLTLFSEGVSLRKALRQVGSGMAELNRWMASYDGFKEAYAMAADWNAKFYLEIEADWIQNGKPSVHIESTLIADPETGQIIKEIPHTKIYKRTAPETLLLNRLKTTMPEIHGKPVQKTETHDIAEILASARRRLGTPDASTE